MKIISKFKIYFSVLAILIISSSCSDWLEPKPISDFTGENAFNTYKGLKTGTVMLDRDIRYIEFHPSNESILPYYFTEATFSDIAINGITDKALSTQDYDKQILPSSSLLGRAYEKVSIFGYWKDLYKGIKDANTIISRSASVDMTDLQRAEILSIAYFHRAWRYYRLVHQFGDVPLYTEEIASPRYDFYSTKREFTLRAMKADLESVVADMPVMDKTNFGVASQGAAYHLLTKINLALAEFNDAIDSASKVIDGGYHQLMTERFGSADAGKNVIWDLHRSENKSIGANKESLYNVIDVFQSAGASQSGTESMRFNLPWYTAGDQIKTPSGLAGFIDNDSEKNPYLEQYGRGVGSIRPTWYSQYTIWQHDNTDLRHDRKSGNWVSMEDLTYNNPALQGTSWYGKNLKKGETLVADTIRAWFDWPQYKVNIPDQKAGRWRGGYSDMYVFRLAETYLLRAEAYCWLDQKDKAAEDVNKVRIRANAKPLTADQITIREILDERARELYYEEPRKTELTRIAFIYAKTGKVADNGQTYSLSNFSDKNFWFDQIMNATTFYNKELKTTAGNEYTISPHHVLWPISEAEIAVYTEGHVNQNLGYPGSDKNIEPIEDNNNLK